MKPVWESRRKPQYAKAVVVHGAEVVLAAGVALHGCLLVPLHRLGIVPRHALALVVQDAEAELGDGVALLGKGTKLAQRRCVVATLVSR